MTKMILITAIWCPSCIIMRPRYNQIKTEYHLDEIQELDFDDDEEIIKTYKIGSTLPVAIIIKDNQEIKRITGEKSVKELSKILLDIK